MVLLLPEEEEAPKDPNARPPLDYEQFKLLAYEFQSYLCHQKYYFKINTLRCFIAGLAAARLILLQGLSGTGKSALPRVFLEYIGGDAYFFPVKRLGEIEVILQVIIQTLLVNLKKLNYLNTYMKRVIFLKPLT